MIMWFILFLFIFWTRSSALTVSMAIIDETDLILNFANDAAQSDQQWIALGFEASSMNNTYTILWHPIHGIQQYILGHHKLLGRELRANEIDTLSCVEIVSQASQNGATNVVITMDIHDQDCHANTIDFSAASMDVIVAYGPIDDDDETHSVLPHAITTRYAAQLDLIRSNMDHVYEWQLARLRKQNQNRNRNRNRNQYAQQELFGTSAHIAMMVMSVALIAPISCVCHPYSNTYGNASAAGAVIAVMMVTFGSCMKVVDLNGFHLGYLHHVTGIAFVAVFGGLLLFGALIMHFITLPRVCTQHCLVCYLFLFIVCGAIQMVSGAYYFYEHDDAVIFTIVIIVWLCLWLVVFVASVVNFRKHAHNKPRTDKKLEDGDNKNNLKLEMRRKSKHNTVQQNIKYEPIHDEIHENDNEPILYENEAQDVN